MRPDPLDDPDLMLSRLFALRPAAARAFLDRGMLCVGCPIAPFHTVIDACEEYGLDEEAFRAELRRAALGLIPAAMARDAPVRLEPGPGGGFATDAGGPGRPARPRSAAPARPPAPGGASASPSSTAGPACGRCSRPTAR